MTTEPTSFIGRRGMKGDFSHRKLVNTIKIIRGSPRNLCCSWSGNFRKSLGEAGKCASERIFPADARLIPPSLCLLCLPRPGEHQEPLEFLRGILYPNFEASPNGPDSSNQFAAHPGHLMPEDMFNTSSNMRSAPIVSLLLSGQVLVAIPFP